MDASNIFKPALSRGELQCVGATTLNEYRKYIEKDGALERRFTQIMVKEPTVEQSIQIILGLRDRYEAYHRATITVEQRITVRMPRAYRCPRGRPAVSARRVAG